MAEKTILSIRFRHPYMHSIDVIREINLVPTAAQSLGEPRVTPKGTELGGNYEETYVTFKYSTIDGSDVVYSIIKATEFLFGHKNFLSSFSKTNGTIGFYLTVICQTWFAFEIPSELIQSLADLNVKLGIEFFADIPRA